MLISDEEAKAVQATAGAVSESAGMVKEGINALRDFGAFMSPLVSPVVKESGKYLADKLRYARIENAIKFQERVGFLLKGLGPEQIETLPLNVMLPILDNALIEEDEIVQNMWASLLANGVDSQSGHDVNKGLIGLLKDMGPMEAHCLKTLVEIYASDKNTANPFHGLRINLLPNAIIDSVSEEGIPETPEDVLIAIHNLRRLGCIQEYSNFETPPALDQHFSNGVTPTFLGMSLIEACTREPE